MIERRDIHIRAEQQGRSLSDVEISRLRELHSERIEAYLDAGHGACWMGNSQVAELVADALRHFDGQRYRLYAWCIMPNHVHILIEPLIPHQLSKILHSWKSFTATAANRLLHRSGDFWQPESYDHLIRDERDFAHAIDYIVDNPLKAGLKDWPWVWRGTVAWASSP
jgi:REP element-mobilizing transposase RayT